MAVPESFLMSLYGQHPDVRASDGYAGVVVVGLMAGPHIPGTHQKPAYIHTILYIQPHEVIVAGCQAQTVSVEDTTAYILALEPLARSARRLWKATHLDLRECQHISLRKQLFNGSTHHNEGDHRDDSCESQLG